MALDVAAHLMLLMPLAVLVGRVASADGHRGGGRTRADLAGQVLLLLLGFLGCLVLELLVLGLLVFRAGADTAHRTQWQPTSELVLDGSWTAW